MIAAFCLLSRNSVYSDDQPCWRKSADHILFRYFLQDRVCVIVMKEKAANSSLWQEYYITTVQLLLYFGVGICELWPLSFSLPPAEMVQIMLIKPIQFSQLFSITSLKQSVH